EILKETKASAAYRLKGAGVIAKRTDRESAAVERRVYQGILPKLPMDSLRCYGYVEDGEEYSWLFLEDSGGVECPLENSTQREAASRWLAQLHTSAAQLSPAPALPARNSNYYLGQLRRARGTIIQNFDSPLLDG